jgi:cytochrome P450/NADPH-cytochrome P450 reductase
MGVAMSEWLKENEYEMVRLTLGKMTLYTHADPEVAERVCTDTETFGKIVHTDRRGPFYAARQAVGAALFTASDTEEEWGMAHRVLISAFSLRGMKPVVPIAVEVVNNTLATLAAAKPTEPLDIGGLMTGITFDGEYSARKDPRRV